MWIRHGGLLELGTTAGIFTAAGEISALYGTYLVLIQLVLMSRSPWLDQVFGQDRITDAHRWVGFGAIWLLVLHAILTTIGYAMRHTRNVVDEFFTLLTRIPTCSGRRSRLGLFIVRGHQLGAGRAAPRCPTKPGTQSTCTCTSPSPSASSTSSSSASTSPRTWWPGSTGWACTSSPSGRCSLFRFGQPIAITLGAIGSKSPTWSRRRPGVASLYLTGRHLDQLAVRAGPVVPAALHDRPKAGIRAHPFSHLGRAERQVPALHRQGARRLHPDTAEDAHRHERLPGRARTES